MWCGWVGVLAATRARAVERRKEEWRTLGLGLARWRDGIEAAAEDAAVSAAAVCLACRAACRRTLLVLKRIAMHALALRLNVPRHARRRRARLTRTALWRWQLEVARVARRRAVAAEASGEQRSEWLAQARAANGNAAAELDALHARADELAAEAARNRAEAAEARAEAEQLAVALAEARAG